MAPAPGGAATFRSGPVQELRLLVHRRSARTEARRFVIEGPKLLAEALASGRRPVTVFFEPASCRPADVAAVDQAAAAGAVVVETGPGVLARALDAATPPPLAAVVDQPDVPLDHIAGDGPVVVLAGVADPGNAGTIVRAAAAAGAAGVVFPAASVDAFSPKAVRATAGAIFRVPVVVGGRPEAILAALGGAGRRRLGALPAGGERYDRVDWTAPVALVLGSESHGLAPAWSGGLDGGVTIPMRGGTDSLNVAMAATVLLFEAARVR